MRNPTKTAQRQCAEWLAECLRLGWKRDSLDFLEASWWKYHDDRGELSNSIEPETGRPELAEAEAAARVAAPLPASAALQDEKESHMFRFDEPWSVQQLSIEEFLVGMSSLGTPQEIQMVGSFASANDSSVRTAHRDVDLPFHRDGIYTKALADMQGGMYVEKPNVDIVGMYCVRANEEPCYTTISEDGVTLLTEVNLRAGEALIMDNRLWHGRRGPVGKRLLIRFWTTRERK